MAPALAKLGVGVGLLGICLVYTFQRPDRKIAAVSEGAAFLIFATPALAVASYLGASLALPLQDALFDGIDRALGFDFPAHYSFVHAHPLAARVLDACYNTSILQVALVLITLAMTGQEERLHAFNLLFVMTAFAVIVVANIMPTLGTYAFYGVAQADPPKFLFDPGSGWQHLPHLTALREGSMREVPFDDLHGLIAFPSFHTALAIVCTWALMRTRFVFWPLALVNVTLIVATPTLGSHYLSDALAGWLIAAASIALVSGFERARACVSVPVAA